MLICLQTLLTIVTFQEASMFFGHQQFACQQLCLNRAKGPALELYSSQLHYSLETSLQMFADQSASSIQTTLAVLRWFLVPHQITLCNQFHSTNCQQLLMNHQQVTHFSALTTLIVVYTYMSEALATDFKMTASSFHKPLAPHWEMSILPL